MNYIQFLAEGSRGHQSVFCRSSRTAGFNQPARGNFVRENPACQAIRVNTVANGVHCQARTFWSSMRSTCTGTFTGTLILGISGSAAAIAGGILLPPLWPISLVVGLVALAILGFSVWNGCRARDAANQLKKWEEPTPHHESPVKNTPNRASQVQDQCAALRARSQKLRETIRAEEEAALRENDLLLQAHLAQYEALISEQKSALVSEATQLQHFISSFEASCSINAPADTFQGRVMPGSGHAQMSVHIGARLIPGCGQTRMDWNAGASLAIDPYLSHAQISAHLSGIQAKLERLNNVYASMTQPLYALHRSNATRIRDWAQAQRNAISSDEQAATLRLHASIHISATVGGQSEAPAYDRKNEGQDKAESALPPKAPSIQKDYQPPEYNPEWKEFVGEVDWKKGVMKHTTIHHRGEHVEKITEIKNHSKS